MQQASPSRPDSGGARRVTFSEAAPSVAPPPPTPPPPSSTGDEEAGPRSDGGQPRREGWYARFKGAVRSLKREVLALYYAIGDPRTPWACKLLPWLVLAYALSPLDLIPDFIPVLGYVDDMLLLPGLLWLAVKLIPDEIMADARQRAHLEPLLLRRNWVAAVLVFLSWVAVALLCAHLAFDKWADAESRPYEWAVLAGTGGLLTIGFVTWMVTRLQYERRRRDEWNASLNASLLPRHDSS
ncbi:hypothetical protein Rsub_07101 [Raphidocelis subcapitata]|uniref:DUF1232 domain-containing protein n=1 Tax=Raphidocelis subcapitata TaxID=307507 RepID=A0A2V0P2K9_9CHLO|nr:hypothetical protein Rsub_07101 [Raphidocelis subcapitata]|eukprot:GBF94114.1 hypothetical protein Rsub_07101 [Raphidocelis subcapitata]